MEKCRCKSTIWPPVPCLPAQPPAWGDKAAAISAALNVTFSQWDAWSPHHLRCLLIFLKCQKSFQTRFECGCQAWVAVLSPPAWLSHMVLSVCGCWLKCWGEGKLAPFLPTGRKFLLWFTSLTLSLSIGIGVGLSCSHPVFLQSYNGQTWDQ